MGVYGNLQSMALPDLLQWAGVNRKTGILQLERNQRQRRIAFQRGRIVACSSTDPALLGHYLLSSGQITPAQLSTAIAKHKQTGRPLRFIISDLGLLSEDEVTRHLRLRAEETIYSLFEWLDADFSFDETQEVDDSFIDVDRTVDEILLNGLQRLDEIQMIRRVFHSSGIVLASTGTPPPPQIASSAMARRILDAIDGRRTLGDILPLAQASEFLVLKFLYHLFHKQVLVIQEVHKPPPGSETILDPLEPKSAPPRAAGPPKKARALSKERAQSLAAAARELSAGLGDMLSDAAEAASAAAAPSAPSGTTADGTAEPPSTVDAEVRVAEQLMARQEFEAALEVLHACQRLNPEQSDLQELIDQAERAYLETTCRDELKPSAIPILQQPAESLVHEHLPAEAVYLTSLIDGEADIKKILFLAPFNDVTVIRAMQKMLERGLISLQPGDTDPDAELETLFPDGPSSESRKIR